MIASQRTIKRGLIQENNEHCRLSSYKPSKNCIYMLKTYNLLPLFFGSCTPGVYVDCCNDSHILSTKAWGGRRIYCLKQHRFKQASSDA